MKRIQNFLVLLSSVFPFGVAACFCFVNLFCGWDLLWDGHDHFFYFLPMFPDNLPLGVLIFAIFVAVFFVAYRFVAKVLENASFVKVAVVIFGIVLLLRLPIAVFAGLCSAPFSDFEASWGLAIGVQPITMCNHQLYPAWVNFSLVEKLLAMGFGSWYGVVLVFGAIMDGVTAVSIYGITRKCFAFSHRMPLLAALLYAFNPSSCVYVATATPEHLCIACFAIATYMTIRMFQGAMLLGLSIGLVAGLGNAVKPFFVLFVAALAFAMALTLPAFRGRWKSLLAGLAVMMMAELMVTAGFTCMRKRIFSQESISPIPHFLCVGLNRQGEGQIHLGGLSRRWAQMVVNGRSGQDAAGIARREILDDWQGNWSSVGKFFMQKMVWAWQDDNMPFRYFEGQVGQKVLQSECGNKSDKKKTSGVAVKRPSSASFHIWKSVQTGALLWYLAFLICCARGAVKIGALSGNGPSRLLMILLVLGFCGVIAICEAQSRYKCFVLPYACVIGCAGLSGALFKAKCNARSRPK